MSKQDLPVMRTVLLVNTSEVFYCISTSINHYVTQQLGVTINEYSWFRNGMNMLICFLIISVQRRSYVEGFTRENLPYFLVRALIGAGWYYTFTATYKLLPLVIGGVLIASSALFTPIMTYVILGEPVSKVDVIAIIISFCGIVMLSFGKENAGTQIVAESASQYLLGIFFGLISALGVGFLTILTRKLKSIETSCLMLQHSLFGWLTYSIVVFYTQGTHALTYDNQTTYNYLVIAGATNTVAQYCFTYSS